MIRATVHKESVPRPANLGGSIEVFVVRLTVGALTFRRAPLGSAGKAREIADTYDGLDPIGINLGREWSMEVVP